MRSAATAAVTAPRVDHPTSQQPDAVHDTSLIQDPASGKKFFVPEAIRPEQLERNHALTERIRGELVLAPLTKCVIGCPAPARLQQAAAQPSRCKPELMGLTLPGSMLLHSCRRITLRHSLLPYGLPGSMLLHSCRSASSVEACHRDMAAKRLAGACLRHRQRWWHHLCCWSLLSAPTACQQVRLAQDA